MIMKHKWTHHIPKAVSLNMQNSHKKSTTSTSTQDPVPIILILTADQKHDVSVYKDKYISQTTSGPSSALAELSKINT